MGAKHIGFDVWYSRNKQLPTAAYLAKTPEYRGRLDVCLKVNDAVIASMWRHIPESSRSFVQIIDTVVVPRRPITPQL